MTLFFYCLISTSFAITTLNLNQQYIDSNVLEQLDESAYFVVQESGNGTMSFQVSSIDTDKNIYVELFFLFPADGDVSLLFTISKNNCTYSKGNNIYATYWDENGYNLGKSYQTIFIPAYSFRSGDLFYITNLIRNDSQTYQYNLKITKTYSDMCPDNCNIDLNYGFCDEIDGYCGCDANRIDLDCSKKALPIMIDNRLDHQFIAGTVYYYFEQLSQLDTVWVEIGVENILTSQYGQVYVYLMFENFQNGAPNSRYNNLSFSFTADQIFRSYIIDMNKLSYNSNLFRYDRLLITVMTQNEVEMYFDISTPSSDSGVNTNLMLIYFLVSLAVVLLLTWIIITLIRYRQARNRVHDENMLQQQQQQQQRRQQKSTMTLQIIDQYMPQIFFKNINKIPKFIEKGFNANLCEACSVCLLEYEKESICRFTPCLHIFHADCLHQWIMKHENCPLCRAELNEKQLEKYASEDKEHHQPEKSPMMLKNEVRAQQLQILRPS